LAQRDGDSDGERETEGGLFSDPRFSIARRDVASLSREKTIVLALLIQLFVAAFSSFLVVGLTSLYDPGSVASGEIVIGVSGDYQDELVTAASGEDGVRAVTYPSRPAAVNAFENGNLHAVMHTDRVDRRISVAVTAPQENIQTTLIVNQVRSLLESVERDQRVRRSPYLTVDTVPQSGFEEVEASPYFGFTYTVLIPLLLFLPPFISGSVAVDVLTEEIERGTLELLRVAPVSLVDIVDGKALGMIVIAPLQALLWIALMSFNNIAVSHVPLLLVMVTALSTVVVVLGLLLGLQTGQRREAQLLYSVTVLFGFGLLVFLPEHPATTVAKLAVDSASVVTYAHVAGYVLLAIVGYALAHTLAGRVSAESL
jgi:ABC-2 type transport system permease protein